MVAALLAVLSMMAGWHGTDIAAQVYRVTQIHRHGVTVWDSGWYGGNYPLGYSVLYPLLAATFGLGLITVISVGLAAWGFDRLVVDHFGSRPFGSWYFAASTLVEVVIGQLPFLLGESLGLMAVLAMTRRRPVLAALSAVGAWGASPADAIFIALAVIAVLLTRGRDFEPGEWRSLAGVACLALGLLAAAALAFPGTGSFPFPGLDLVAILAACAVVISGVVSMGPILRNAAALYAGSCVGLYFVPNPLGASMGRLATDIGVPLLICFARTLPLRLGALVAIPAIIWQWAPGAAALSGSDRAASDTRAFYAPLLREMAVLDRRRVVRIEIPPIHDHWESAFVAPYIALARGWERQLDTVDNPIFYQRGLIAGTSYQRWLTENGIEWVALANTEPDYAAKDEVAMLRSPSRRPADLRLIWHTAEWKLWRVIDSPGLVQGPAQVITLEPDRIVLTVTRALPVIVRIRYNRYWTVGRGQGCVEPGTNGWTEVKPNHKGTLLLQVSLRLQVSLLPGSAAIRCR